MKRNRCDLVMKYFHSAKNREWGKGDNFAKVKPLYDLCDLINQWFAKFFLLSFNFTFEMS